MKLSSLIKIFGAASAALILFSVSAQAAGGLMVTPSRIEFKNDVKTEEIRLINRGNETASYRVSFQNLRMTKDGAYEEINEANKSGEKFADKYIKYSPRRVTLKPGETQTIRLMIQKPEEPGEYRSHMLFREEAPASFGNSVEQTTESGKKISVILRPVFAISIPVIVRSGDVKAEVTIDNLAVNTDPKTKAKSLSLQLNRTGDASVNGSVVVTLVQKGSKEKLEIGSLSNISVYTPYPTRTVSVPLEFPKSAKLTDATIEAKFYEKKDEPIVRDRGTILAQKSITLN